MTEGRVQTPRDVIHAALAAGMPNGPGVTEPMRTRFAEIAVMETDAVLAALAEAGYEIAPARVQS